MKLENISEYYLLLDLNLIFNGELKKNTPKKNLQLRTGLIFVISSKFSFQELMLFNKLLYFFQIFLDIKKYHGPK